MARFPTGMDSDSFLVRLTPSKKPNRSGGAFSKGIRVDKVLILARGTASRVDRSRDTLPTLFPRESKERQHVKPQASNSSKGQIV